MNKPAALLLFLLLVPVHVFCQRDMQDSAISCGLFRAHYSYQLPGAALADRFGANSNIGAGFAYKTAGNWLFSLDGGYLFGNKVREDDILDGISTSQGWVIDANGTYADVFLYERGYCISAQIGKLIPYGGDNMNSGILISAGGGYMLHKIRIDNTGNTAPQLSGDYKRGYDRLTGGYGLHEFIGYHYQGNSRIYNFYGGFEFSQYWTHSLRDFNFDTRTADKAVRFETLWGAKVGWIIPFRKRSSQVFYYY